MDPIEHFDQVAPTLGKLVRGVRADQLDNPTPCSEFTVRDLLGHFIGNLEAVTGGFRGEPVTDLSPKPEMLGADPGATYDRVVTEFSSVIREPGAMDRTIALPAPFGDVPAPVLESFIAFDFMIHSWDLARATGQDYEPPETLVAPSDVFARQVISPELRTPGVFGPELEPPAGATMFERLVAFSGRRV